MSLSAKELRAALGLPEPAENHAEEIADKPWYLNVLLGVSGWVAGLFLLLCLSPAFANSRVAMGILGTVCIGVAALVFRAKQAGFFIDQFALALSLAGQAMVVIGFLDKPSVATVAMTSLLLQVLMLLLMRNALHCMLSSLFICFAWAVLIRTLLGGNFWASPVANHGAGSSPLLALAIWGAVTLPIAIAVFVLIRLEAGWMAAKWQSWVRPVLTGQVTGLVFAALAAFPWDLLQHAVLQNGWLAFWPFLSALAALGALCAAFALQHRALMGIAIIGALFHVSVFYYALGTTLLVKSLLMLLLGVVLLFAAWVMKRMGAQQ